MKKILIVDDEKDIRFILEEILTENNYSVVTVGTIKDAEDYIDKNTFDLALLDVLLDEKSNERLQLNGEDLFMNLKSINAVSSTSISKSLIFCIFEFIISGSPNSQHK